MIAVTWRALAGIHNMFRVISKILSTLLWSTAYLISIFHENPPITFLRYPVNKQRNTGQKLPRQPAKEAIIKDITYVARYKLRRATELLLLF